MSVLSLRRQRLLDMLNDVVKKTHKGHEFYQGCRGTVIMLVRGEADIFETHFPELGVRPLEEPIVFEEEGLKYTYTHEITVAGLLASITDVLCGKRLAFKQDVGDGEEDPREGRTMGFQWFAEKPEEAQEESRTIRGRFAPCPRCKHNEIKLTMGTTSEGQPTADIRCPECDWFVSLVGAAANWPTLHWNRVAADYIKRREAGPALDDDWWCSGCCSGFKESEWSLTEAMHKGRKVMLCPHCDVALELVCPPLAEKPEKED